MENSADGWHEPLRGEDHSTPSNRSFGLLLSSALMALGAWTLWHGQSAAIWELSAAAVFLAITLSQPRLLTPLNRLWALLGRLLQAIVTPLIMAVLFYGIVTPIGALMRSFGRDPLQRT